MQYAEFGEDFYEIYRKNEPATNDSNIENRYSAQKTTWSELKDFVMEMQENQLLPSNYDLLNEEQVDPIKWEYEHGELSLYLDFKMGNNVREETEKWFAGEENEVRNTLSHTQHNTEQTHLTEEEQKTPRVETFDFDYRTQANHETLQKIAKQF